MILFPNRDEVIKKEKKYFKLLQKQTKQLLNEFENLF